MGEDLAVIPCAVEEKVAIVICMVPSGDHAMDVERPLETVSYVGYPDVEDLEGTLGNGVPRKIILSDLVYMLRCVEHLQTMTRGEPRYLLYSE